jgi:hypothetical protein
MSRMALRAAVAAELHDDFAGRYDRLSAAVDAAPFSLSAEAKANRALR